MTELIDTSSLPGDQPLGSMLLTDLARPADRAAAESTAASFAEWSRRYVTILVVCDVIAGMLGAAAVPVLAGAIHVAALWPRPVTALELAAAGLLWPTVVLCSRGYRRRVVGTGSLGGREVRAIFSAAVAIITATALASVILDLHALLVTVVLAAAVTVLASTAGRGLCRAVLHFRQRRGHDQRRIAVVGTAQSAAELVSAIDRDGGPGVVVAGAYVPETELADANALELEVLGDLQAATMIAAADEAVDAVVVAGPESAEPGFVRELARSLEGEEVDLLIHPGIIETSSTRLEIEPSDAVPLVHVEQPRFSGGQLVSKRLADLVLAFVGLVISLPVWLVVAAMIAMDDRGPVIFRQRRVGRDGRTFTMLKFRTMSVDAEEQRAGLIAEDEITRPLFKISNDPRVTRAGRRLRRLSIDEVPQLVNVLLGSMSLVGPRPPLPEEVAGYDTETSRRLLIKPGLTGLWQVSGRSLLCWEDSVRLDLRYVENWSLLFDLRILIKTVSAVLRRHGAY